MRGQIETPSLVDEEFGQVVEALTYLQDSSGIYREIQPASILEGGREIVTAATLLRGEKIDFTWESLNLSLSRWGPELDALVQGIPQEFIIEQDSSLELEDVTIPIGRIRTYIQSARLSEPEAVQQALLSGLVPNLRLIPGDSDKAQRTLVP